MSTNPPAPSGAPGSGFSVTATVYNAGTSPALSSKMRYYLSLDAVKSADDVLLTGTRSVTALDPGESVSGTLTVTSAKTTPVGTYFLLACADDMNTVGETDEANNCAATPGATVTLGQPDLVEGAISSPPATRARGTTFAVTDTALNLGNVPSTPSKTRYYLSIDAVKGAGDVLLAGTRSVPALAAGASHSGTKSVRIPAATALRAYYVLACADDTSTAIEGSESNNCTPSSSTVTVTP
jgi:hypothetical protein